MKYEKRKIISDICPLYKKYGTCEQCNTELDIDGEPSENFNPAASFITADDVISESVKSLSDMLAEAKAKALKEGIKANTVIIDEHFAKVNAFDFVFGRVVMHLPPMICGLEIQVSDELPDGYDFAVLEVPETERERLIKEAKAEVAREIFDELEEILCGEFLTERFWFDLGKLRIKHMEGQK